MRRHTSKEAARKESFLPVFLVWVLPWAIAIPLAANLGQFLPSTEPASTEVAVSALLQFILTLVVFIVLIRLFGTRLLAVGSMITVGVGTMVFLNAVLGVDAITSFLAAVSLMIIAQTTQALWYHNGLILIGLLGLGLALGSTFSPGVFLGLLIVLSIYDLFAVFSNFIPNLVHQMAKNHEPIYVLLLIPQTWREWFLLNKKSRLRVIGTGDIFAPLLFLTALAGSGQVTLAWICFVGAVFGVLGNIALMQSNHFKRGIPALPLLTVGIIVAQVLTLLF